MKSIWLAPFLTVVLSAADISGKWAGIIEVADTSSGTTVNTPVKAELMQKDHTVSGKIGRKEDVQTEEIRNGRIDGSKIVFEVNSLETTSAVKFALTLDGDRLEGEMKGSMDTGPISGKVHLTRAHGE